MLPPGGKQKSERCPVVWLLAGQTPCSDGVVGAARRARVEDAMSCTRVYTPYRAQNECLFWFLPGNVNKVV